MRHKRNYFKPIQSVEAHDISAVPGIAVNKAVVRDAETNEYTIATGDAYARDLGLLVAFNPSGRGVKVTVQGDHHWPAHGFTLWKRLYVDKNGDLTETKPNPQAFSRFMATDADTILVGKIR